ncbi:MAG: ABC transporter permease [Gemmatimonadota bacterium]|nr:ABC transporter permease [Gemmatimonadota bacterium]
MSQPVPAGPHPTLRFTQTDGQLTASLSGSWVTGQSLPTPEGLVSGIVQGRPERVVIEVDDLSGWDSRLIGFLDQVGRAARQVGATPDWSGLPGGVQRLLALASAVPERTDARRDGIQTTTLEAVGRRTISATHRGGDALAFLGEVILGFGRFFRGKARYRPTDLWLLFQEAGMGALGVVSLINILIGMILAFVGASQLQAYGASIYVADLVAIAVVRDMAAIMTAIVMSGRSGAAYAAALGTMNSNQEIDALRTLGISPIEFLVIPRVLALTLMLPLLTIYADVVGIIGGAFVADTMLGTSLKLYLQQTWSALSPKLLLGGLFKATTYGLLVGLAGTYQGLRSGRSAAGVGDATTRAVVASIILIISAAGAYAVLFYAFGW